MCLLWTATVSSVLFATMAGTSMQPQWFAGMTYTLNVMTLNPSKMSSTIQTAGIYRGTPVVLVAFRGSQTSCFLHGWNALHWEGGAPAGLRLQQPWWLLRLWWCCRCICLQNLKSHEVQKHFLSGVVCSNVSHPENYIELRGRKGEGWQLCFSWFSILFCKVGQGRSLAMYLQWAAEASLVLSVTWTGTIMMQM